MMEYFLLFCAAVMAGVLNSLGGGGSYITFPMLIVTGMPPIIANATNTLAVWVGTLSSVAAYRNDIKRSRCLLPVLGLASLLGGEIGAVVLLRTPEMVFSALIPYLLLLATTLFAMSGKITRHLYKHRGIHMGVGGAILMQLAVAFYGGYFGGGMGIIVLALLAMVGLSDMHEMNAIRSVLGALINGSAVAVFILCGKIAWPQALVMMAGAVLGGYAGALFFKRVHPELMRKIVISIGVIMTIYFFIR